MEIRTILIVGGYGGTGRPLCRTLLEVTDAAITIAGRNLHKAQELCADLKEEFPSKNISAVFADASDQRSLAAAFQGATLVIDATTATNCVPNIAKASLAAAADYLDFHFDQKVVSELESLRQEITDSGRCFITQAGFHPGLPSAFVRYAGPQFDTYDKAIVGMAMNTRVEDPESIYELVDALADYTADIFVKGKWRLAGYRDLKRLNFGSVFGTRTCYPMQMEEMYAMPAMFSLEETGVYVAGFNWFVDYLVFPLAVILPAIRRGLGRYLIARLLVFGLNTFSGRRQGVSFVLEAEGTKCGRPVKFSVIAEHADAYLFTAIPIAACVRQYLGGSLSRPGLWFMGHIVDPDTLIKDMGNMGIRISANRS
jgi:hypothetical protein